MRRWRPAPSAGSLVGILAWLLCLGGLVWVVVRAIPGAAEQTMPLVIFWLAAGLLAVFIVILTIFLWGYLTLSYDLDDTGAGALVLRWAWRTTRIPLDEIEYFGPARQILAPSKPGGFWPWPGYYLNTVRDPDLGDIRLLATQPLRRLLLICSARGSFAISPDRPSRLLEQYHALREARRAADLGLLTTAPPLSAPPVTDLEEDEEAAFPILAASSQRAFRERTDGQVLVLFADRPAVVLMLAGGALVAAMLWFILLRYDAVPQTLPLHYNATGQPDRIGTPREIFLLPLITALVAVANITLAWSVVRFDRFAARLLLSGTCLVQAVAWVALLKLF
ncbi:MAG TPA: DUF1648 domain-containing protein [Thermomicrobiales bacterium]|nr:DUF1648 domain-containing protein [Thermomicrobiales bacterium]